MLSCDDDDDPFSCAFADADAREVRFNSLLLNASYSPLPMRDLPFKFRDPPFRLSVTLEHANRGSLSLRNHLNGAT